MTIDIPKWVFAAFVGAAPMLGIVFFILFSCTLLGLVQRCKINLKRSYAKRRRYTSYDQSSIHNLNSNNGNLFQNPLTNIIISPFDDIPMKDIDADSTSKGYSEPKDGEFLFLFSLRIKFECFLKIFPILRHFDAIEVLIQVRIMIMVHQVFLMIMIMNKIVYP
jgi:hypothetical protein